MVCKGMPFLPCHPFADFQALGPAAVHGPVELGRSGERSRSRLKLDLNSQPVQEPDSAAARNVHAPDHHLSTALMGSTVSKNAHTRRRPPFGSLSALATNTWNSSSLRLFQRVKLLPKLWITLLRPSAHGSLQ